MATITTRSGKGSALTHTELDNNFSNLNSDKVEASGDTITGNLNFQDNAKAQFGTTNDLQIYHDGSNSYINDVGTGNLNINAVNFVVANGSPDYDYIINGLSNDSVKLYHNGNEKIKTTSTGVDVTGTVVSDGLTVDGNSQFTGNSTLTSSGGLNLKVGLISGSISSASDAFVGVHNTGGIGSTAGDLLFVPRSNVNAAVRAFTGNGTPAERFTINHGGDVSFYEDTGTTAKFFWDASAESLTLGTALGGTASHPLNVGGEIAVINNSGANPSDAGSFYWKESGATWGTDMFGARARYDGSANILKFEFANLTSTGTNLELERDTGNVHIPTGKLGIGTDSPAMALDIVGANGDQFRVTNTTADATLKNAYHSVRHYTNAEEDFVWALASSSSSANTLSLGGNTGLGNAATQIRFYTGANTTTTTGSERMRINADGNVGIGNSNPAYALDVIGGTTVARFQNTSGVANVNVKSSGSRASLVLADSAGTNGAINSTTGDGIAFGIGSNFGSNEAMRIDSSGNVGIGTSSPATNLEISDASAAILRLTDSGSSAYSQVRADSGTLQLDANAGNAAVTEYISMRIAGSEAMRITSGGNVGIGTANPQSKLQVDGTFTATGNIFLHEASASSSNAVEIGRNRSVDGAVFLDLTTSTTEGDFNFRLNRGSGTNGALQLRNRGTGAMEFLTNDSEAMRIDSSGNLLVGKTTENTSQSDGVEARADGRLYSTTNGTTVAKFNRRTSDGAVVDFRKDNTTVGTISAASTNVIYGNDTRGIKIEDTLIIPRDIDDTTADNQMDLGSSTSRWKDLYLSGGAYLGGAAAANKLDDYEEGTFTIAVEGSTTAGTGTYATRNARYTKIGNVVHVRMYINMSAHTGAGNLLITGLPFNAKNASNEFFTASIDFSNGISKTADNYIYGLLRPNTSQIEVQRQPTSGTSTVWNLYVPLDTSFQAALNLTYVTD